MSIEEELLETFVTEARDLVRDMEQGLLALENDPGSDETVNALFRAAHTLKGSAGLFGYDHVVQFAHVVETTLDAVRAGELPVTPELISALLPCADHAGDLVEGLAEGRTTSDPREAATSAQLLAVLGAFLGGPAAPAAPLEEPAETGPGTWTLFLRFGPDSLRHGMDPLSFLRHLTTLGTIEGVTVEVEDMPDAASMDPETCYLAFEVALATSAGREEIEAVFDFVRDDGRIRLLPPESTVSELISTIAAMPEGDGRLGEILLLSGAISGDDLADALRVQQTRTLAGAGAHVPLGEILVSERIVSRALVDAALRKQRQTTDTKTRDNKSLRVDADRLDALVDLVGELVIAQATAGLRTGATGDPGLLEAQGEVMRLVEEVRDCALSLRMVQIGTTFRRFERVVRDVGADLGKDVALVVTGGDTEVDKTLVERIGDPLLHLVRNALDHGIESSQERERVGKSSRGTLRLNAYHDSGSIVLEVADDGRGLDRDRILAKGLERGLVEPGAVLTDQEVFALVFEPGFSTKDVVSDLSGRGVGMDVVRRNVAALRGTIQVESALGTGTTVRIRLPLTLAIIDGFLVGVGGASYVVPLEQVTECVVLPSGPHARDVMDLRGEVLPFLRLRDVFGIEGERPRRENVVVVEHLGRRAGLVVDALMGEFQTVIKPLGVLFGHVRGIGGSTILGNGDAALIIDVGALVTRHTELEHAASSAA